MYAFIEGSLIEINPATAIINCNGIGYEINISLQTFSKINSLEKCLLYTHLVVREDAHVLYGFADKSERQIFLQLISVSGVGPNTARLILSSLSSQEVIEAIAGENVKLMQSVKGIGAKSASRIIIDLKDKVGKDISVTESLPSGINTAKQEALSALVMLGFAKNVAEKAIEQTLKQHGAAIRVDELVKAALKMI